MIASEIMLPPHAPEIYLDRATLWNAVENCEKHPKAQLAYSFDIAMQNELTLEENMELARKFVQEQFVTKGMIADLAFHSPEPTFSRSVAFASLRSSCVRMPEKSVSSSSSFVTPSAITKRSAYSCSLGSRPMKAHFVGVTT